MMLTFKHVTDKEDCRILWEEFSPKEILWDLWDFRYCFHTKYFKFNFILGLNNGKQVGIIPLVLDKETDVYTYFGDTFPEQNKFFLSDKRLIPKFLNNCPEGTSIYNIKSEESQFYNFSKGDKRYFLNLKKYGNSFENYIGSFTKKHRKNLRYDLKKLKEKGYEVVNNNVNDFKGLVEMNKSRFGSDSDYNDKNFTLSMNKLMGIAKKMNILDIITLMMDNKAEAVGLGAIYNKCYYVLAVGRNPEIKNVGKLLITEQIKSAIKNKCKEVDFLSTESNWKELWNFDSEQMYEYHDEFIEI